MEQVPLSVAQSQSPLEQDTPLFSSLLNCRLQQHEKEQSLDPTLTQSGIHGLSMEEHSNYPLTASVDYYDDCLQLSIESCAGINSENVANYFSTAIQHLIQTHADSDIRECELPIPTLLSNEEQQTLTFCQYQEMDKHYTQSLPSILSDYALTQPDVPALICDDSILNFAELNQGATAVAQYLQNNGISSGDTVGVCYRRSTQLVTLIFGIMKTGAAYVPLSAEYPDTRLQHMINDSQLSKILVEDSLHHRFAALSDRCTSFTDKQINTLAVDPARSLPPVNSEGAAYIMYTSGSTGLAKGVVVQHKNVINLVKNKEAIDINAASTFLGLSNIAFDGSVFDLYMSLMNGCTLVMLNDSQIHQPQLWPELCEKFRVDTMLIPTALFNHFVSESISSLSYFKQLFIGGEQANPNVVKTFLEHFPENKLINAYGPTEGTVYATCAELTEDNYYLSPIGRAINNVSVYVLDEQKQLLPFGVTGELYIGGDGVAQGYLNQDDLNQEKFSHDPFSDRPGARLYRTGDRVRWLENGTLTFSGRTDNQVKIRGFRIEIGEIERAAESLELISQCFVQVIKHNGQDQLFAAVVLTQPDKDIDVKTLRQLLATKLPTYMLPDQWLSLESMPLTANGKVDNNAISQAIKTQKISGVRKSGLAPEGKLEQSIARLWAQLLAVDINTITQESSFFELGGNSLLAMRLSSAITTEFTINISVKELFEYQTVTAQAELIELMKQLHQPSDGTTPDQDNEEKVSITL